LFDTIVDKLVAVFGFDTNNQRIDHVHIQSNILKLSPIRIFTQTIKKFLVNLKRHHREFFDSLGGTIIESYRSKKSQGAFSMVKPSESAKTLKIVSTDLFNIIEQFKDLQAIYSIRSYKLMQRLLAEQCKLKDHNVGKKVTIKKPCPVASDSLQDPSDGDRSLGACTKSKIN
jgi:hypothetical protein